MSNFEIDGIQVPLESLEDFNQDYTPIEASSVVLMSDGDSIKQNAFTKISTTLSGSGRVPAGLDGLDFGQSMLLKCAMPKVIGSTSNAIVLPTARRTDTGFEPKGYALVNRRRVDTTINVVTDTATMGVVAGATHYQAFYYPEIIVFASPPQISGDIHTQTLQWQLEAVQKKPGE